MFWNRGSTSNAVGIRTMAASVALAFAAGCTGPILDRVAGAEVDEGGFGTPTMENMLAMSGAESAVSHLGARFAAEVASTITFAFDSATLDAAARTALDQQANFMRRFPEVRFSVYGHTDEVGSAAYNKALGLRRARAAVAYLGQRGVSAGRLTALASFGEARPVVPTPAAERRNRRTVTEVSGLVTGAPMLLDGKYAQLAYRNYVGRVTYPATKGAPTGPVPIF